jgi:hypothetical protein
MRTSQWAVHAPIESPVRPSNPRIHVYAAHRLRPERFRRAVRPDAYCARPKSEMIETEGGDPRKPMPAVTAEKWPSTGAFATPMRRLTASKALMYIFPHSAPTRARAICDACGWHSPRSTSTGKWTYTWEHERRRKQDNCCQLDDHRSGQVDQRRKAPRNLRVNWQMAVWLARLPRIANAGKVPAPISPVHLAIS